jgi:hypothetical protein
MSGVGKDGVHVCRLGRNSMYAAMVSNERVFQGHVHLCASSSCAKSGHLLIYVACASSSVGLKSIALNNSGMHHPAT